MSFHNLYKFQKAFLKIACGFYLNQIFVFEIPIC